MKHNFKLLFDKQASLDEYIASNHQVTYETTRIRRTLALLIEISELANSTRCFKYWSNKPSEPKERVIDEYADSLHFLLSLGIDLGVTSYEYDYLPRSDDLSSMFIEIYQLISNFIDDRNEEKYKAIFDLFLSIGYKLNFSLEEIEDAYFSKLDVNYKRQDTNY